MRAIDVVLPDEVRCCDLFTPDRFHLDFREFHLTCHGLKAT
ncbi:hypothetical protein AB0B45_40715 [Nonomuraea sp. NPDC049152]